MKIICCVCGRLTYPDSWLIYRCREPCHGCVLGKILGCSRVMKSRMFTLKLAIGPPLNIALLMGSDVWNRARGVEVSAGKCTGVQPFEYLNLSIISCWPVCCVHVVEHRWARGFEPVLIHSVHYFCHSGLRRAVSQFLNYETAKNIQRAGSSAINRTMRTMQL